MCHNYFVLLIQMVFGCQLFQFNRYLFLVIFKNGRRKRKKPGCAEKSLSEMEEIFYSKYPTLTRIQRQLGR